MASHCNGRAARVQPEQGPRTVSVNRAAAWVQQSGAIGGTVWVVSTTTIAFHSGKHALK